MQKYDHNTIVESVVLYGAVTWTISKKKKNNLLATEMENWRRTAGTSR